MRGRPPTRSRFHSDWGVVETQRSIMLLEGDKVGEEEVGVRVGLDVGDCVTGLAVGAEVVERSTHVSDTGSHKKLENGKE
jgi:hypothetical protein